MTAPDGNFARRAPPRNMAITAKRRMTAAIAVAIITAAIGFPAAAADPYPDKPVNYVIPFGAGGESSIAARLQAPAFKRLTGQDLVIKYRPGGGGAVVWSQLNAMPADGYTIAGINLPHILLQPERGAHYRTEDLAVVHIFHYTPHAVIVRDDSSIDTLDELVELMRENPGKVSFSGSGRGTANHLAQLLFSELTKTHSTYRAQKGTAASVTALMQEQVDAAWAYTTTGAEYAGKVRMLAVAMEQRHPRFPDVPTFEELGYDIVGGAYRGIAVPKSTPEGLRKRISDLFGEISLDPTYRRKSHDLGFVLLDYRYDRVPYFLEARRQEYLPLAKTSGLID